MTTKPEAAPIKVVKLLRMLESDVRPMERCCGHHLLAHDAFGCLITGCGCRRCHRRMNTPQKWRLKSNRLESE